MDKDEGVIALIGAGNGGLALMKVLMEIPGVRIKYVCDINPLATGVVFAKEHQIKTVTDYNQVIADSEINLIFEATGNLKVFEDLSEKKPSRISLIGADGSKIIYNLLDAYNEININLNEYKTNLEKKIIERTEDLENANSRLEKEMLEYEKISQKLQEINNEKTKYLLYATHQLKAPFAAIQSYVDIILDGYTGEISQRTRDIVVKIRQRCELLSNVIKEMLELAKLKARDNTYVHQDKIDLNKIITNMVTRFKVIALRKDIRIELNSFIEPIFIRGNENQIEILFSILIENAINYSPANTIITVTLKKIEGSRIFVEVQDQGIGILEKNLPKIFNEFFRSNNAVEFHKNGTGLGLSIAQEIASIHDTVIQVRSQMGVGSSFSIIFHQL